MRNGAQVGILASLVVIGALGLSACGGDESARREATWRASERLPTTATHWWWEPVERICEEDRNCPSGERCQLMRLGTCPECPRGESAKICVPREGNGARADRRR